MYWYELFKIEKYETNQRKFAYTIYTDGKVAVVRLRKPKFETVKTKDIKKINYEQLVGVDPGVRSLQTSCNDTGRIIETTTPSYRHDCKMKYACKKREMWYKKWEHYEMWRNIPSFKTSNTEKMKTYFKYVYPHTNVIFNKKKDGTYTKAKKSIINSVIRCKLNECKLCCMDRDINASKNILFLLQLQKAGKKRPECFLPSSKDDEPPTIINCDTPSGR